MPINTTSENLSSRIENLLPLSQQLLLRQAGRLADRMEMSVYLVGGPVRDLLLGRQQLDIDLVVEGKGPTFARAYARELDATITVHDSFLTGALTLPDGQHIDVATARTESYERPGALPIVEPAILAADLARRDFTVNALAVRLNPDRWGLLYDPLDGRDDLNAGLIRVLHNRSFMDDPTRLVRAVGFEVRLGFSLEEETLALAEAAIGQQALDLVSAQRRGEVFLPLLETEAGPGVLARMAELGMLEAMHLGAATSNDLWTTLKRVPEALEALDEAKSGHHMALSYLALVATDADSDLAAFTKYLQMASKDSRCLGYTVEMLKNSPAELVKPEVSPAELYFALQMADLVTAAVLWARGEGAVRKRIEQYWQKLRHVEADISGDDLRAAGARPAPDFSQALDEALRVKLNDPAADREQQLRAALFVLSKNSESPRLDNYDTD